MRQGLFSGGKMTYRAYQKPAAPRWITVLATRNVHSETMQFESSTIIQVLATDDHHAMRTVRPEFRNFHLRVLP